MSPPTYLIRVQQALSDVVKEEKNTVLHAELLHRLRPKTLRSSQTPASPFRREIRSALLNEIHAGRLFVDTTSFPAVLTITDAGIGFYAEFVVMYPGRRVRSRPKGTPRDEALNDYLRLVERVAPIRKIVMEQTATNPNLWNVEKLPEVIRSHFETEENLRVENSTLIEQVNEVSFEADKLENVLAHF